MMNRSFSAIRACNNLSSPKACKNCGQPATKDALFNVGNGIAVIEKYCDQCAKAVEDNNRGLV
jgi:hypothetical protein